MAEAGFDFLKKPLTVILISDIRLYRQALCAQRLNFFFHFFQPICASGTVDHDPVSTGSKF